MKKYNFYSTGKKKTSISRIFFKIDNELKEKFLVTVNKIICNKYFNNSELILSIIFYPFNLIEIKDKFKIFITVKGGGIMSQAYSIRHGIVKSLILYNIEYRKIFKPLGLITRDSRIVERKKVGYKKSRKKPQFSKR